MQAITIAIGKTGIDFFAQKLVAKELVTALSALTPPDKEIRIDTLQIGLSSANNIDIRLRWGKLNNFAPAYQSVSQQKSSGVFSLILSANEFSAQYNWYETYQWISCSFIPNAGTVCQDPVNEQGSYNYTPDFSNFIVTVPLKFQFNSTKQDWEVVVLSSTANPPSATANIPPDSIIQGEDRGCFSSHVSDATATAVASIDFGTPVGNLIKNVVTSIPDSGNLGNGIIYDFSLGDSGLLFPNNDGIQMGVKGGASFNGAAFSGVTPPKLPLPTPPSDDDTQHHLNMYVSSYEIDALYWAYWKAGKLNVVVNPTDLQDPKILKVATYISSEPALKPYHLFSMQAQISPAAAPVSTFQMVWILTETALNALKNQLPSNIWNSLNILQGNNYITQSSFEQDMTEVKIPSTYFPAIEKSIESMGMVVNSDLNFDLIIENQEPDPPDIKFTVARTDILSNLRLGVGANNTQTMQYDFTNVSFSTTFISSSVPGFVGGDYFSNTVWAQAGEPQYEKAVADMAKTGVPLPIMADFQFDFENAQLSIQQGYISILASVLYKNK